MPLDPRPPGRSLGQELAERGFSRRRFLEFCSAMVATLALPSRYVSRVASALDVVERPVLVWLEFQDCAGNSEAMLRSPHPEVSEIVLDMVSWRYHELIMAGAGEQAEQVLAQVVEEYDGRFICVVEGAIPTADGGVYCTINGRTALEIVQHVCPHAALNIAVGACAWDGGFVRSSPNPTGAVGLQEVVSGPAPLVNLGGCPHNAANTAALLVHYLTFGELPTLDQYRRPLFAYGDRIHDQCERRAHYDAGRFVEDWDDEGARKGWCLYKMGCKGPSATFNCPTVRWNSGTSWPVQSGHNCIACAAPRFWDTRTPFYETTPDVPGIGFDVTASEIGLGLVAASAIGFGAHGVASAVRAKIRPPEEEASSSAPAATREEHGPHRD